MITTINAIAAFLFAGKARFTLVSSATGARYTYRVTKAANDDGPWFVSVLTGSDNEADYSYMACIFPDRPARLVHTRKSRVGAEAPSAKALAWYLAQLEAANEDSLGKVEFHHEGACGRCGRALTVPESIETGLGPVCAGKVAA
jgi:hypothetical protein